MPASLFRSHSIGTWLCECIDRKRNKTKHKYERDCDQTQGLIEIHRAPVFVDEVDLKECDKV